MYFDLEGNKVRRTPISYPYSYDHCPSFNGYGSQEEIENEYELLVPQEELSNYSDWNEILKLVDNC